MSDTQIIGILIIVCAWIVSIPLGEYQKRRDYRKALEEFEAKEKDAAK